MNRFGYRIKRAARWLRYLYFLRFSLMLWLFPLLMVRLNETGARTLTSGLVTPEYFSQYLCVAFFVVSSGFVALIMARGVAINGAERFGEGPPRALKKLLKNTFCRWEHTALGLSQLPNLYVFFYLVSNGAKEGVESSKILGGIVAGILLAFIIWYIVNIYYYLNYRIPFPVPNPVPVPAPPIVLGENAARTILFPRRYFGLEAPRKGFVNTSLESAVTLVIFPKGSDWLTALGDFLRVKLGLAGYLYKTGRLYEAHAFSIQSALGFLCLYAAMGPLTAPLPNVGWWLVLPVVSLAFPAIFAFLKTVGATTVGGGSVSWLRWPVYLGIFGFLAAVAWLYVFSDSERFPSFALILIMVITVLWTMGGIAFFADRFRIPVFTTLLVLVILPRALNWDAGREEHFISVVNATQLQTPLQIPEDILKNRLEEEKSRREGDEPLIVVTATGGGLHAAAWTATVLGQLEEEFANANNGPATSFHEHLLLASTVSGGSLGLLSYLNAIVPSLKNPKQLPQSSNWKRMVNSAQCPSIDAVSWGLTYYDLPKAFLPIFPFAITPSPGLFPAPQWELDDSPIFKDRTWTLRKGFARNLDSEYCQQNPNDPQRTFWRNWLSLNRDSIKTIEDDERSLTLETYLPNNSKWNGYMEKPFAFSMNTTTVEGGYRLLLANYQVDDPIDEESKNESHPAQSFLYLYRDCQKKGHPVDLPLATAAQMSATFPYVSSAARIPVEVNPFGLHFIDGGYYDNDGTSTAIEFLRSALKRRKPEDGPLRIILVEIRNSPDTIDDTPQPVKKLSNLFDQILAPPSGFYNGGHDSVTERNRVGLDLLLKANAATLRLKRIVLDDPSSVGSVGTDPLNWSLTPAQRDEVYRSARQCSLLARYAEVKRWLYKSPDDWKGLSPLVPAVCVPSAQAAK